jgi:hypothetical protein
MFKKKKEIYIYIYIFFVDYPFLSLPVFLSFSFWGALYVLFMDYNIITQYIYTMDCDQAE